MSQTPLMTLLFAGAALGLPSLATADDGYPVAGTEPSKRPLGAPVIQSVQKDSDWYNRALTGISQPYPKSLSFLEDQGNWYTPFNRPGMTDPYDIRGWHR
jgi:hypothetical protein